MSPTNDPTFEAIDAEYKRISGLIGEAYVTSDLAKRRLRDLVREREAVMAKWRFYQETLPKGEVSKNEATKSGE